MKALLFVLFSLIAFSLTANAQFARTGVIETGGSVSFSSTTAVFNDETDDESSSDFSFQPYIGYFFADGFEVGLIPSFSTSSYGDNSSSSIGIFLAPAYNFILTNSNVYPFIEARIGYNSVNWEDVTGGVTVESTLSGLSYGARGGVKVLLGGKSLLNLGLEYMMITLNPEDPPAGFDGRYGANSFAFSAGWTVFF